jgi:glycosyltransferase involved in cell wall biosynthesis
MVKVSVILPIYNVAPYLEAAFDSILNQSLKEIEVIAVNDGSTDQSGDIIKQYQQRDSRIISFSQENKGLSGARNTALRHATGKYIYMMDSDDMLSSPDALQLCYDYAEKNQADFIFFDRDWFTDDGSIATKGVHSTQFVEENKKYEGENLLSHLLDTSSYNAVVWLLFINHDFLKKTGFSFYEGIIHEDELFTTRLMLSSNAIYCLKRSLIKHRIRPTSIVGKGYRRRNMDCYLTVADELLRFSQAPIIHKFLRYTLSKVFYTGHLIPYKDKPAVFWRAMKSGYLKYIGLKSLIKFLWR